MALLTRESVLGWIIGCLAALGGMALTIVLSFAVATISEERTLTQLSERVVMRAQIVGKATREAISAVAAISSDQGGCSPDQQRALASLVAQTRYIKTTASFYDAENYCTPYGSFATPAVLATPDFISLTGDSIWFSDVLSPFEVSEPMITVKKDAVAVVLRASIFADVVMPGEFSLGIYNRTTRQLYFGQSLAVPEAGELIAQLLANEQLLKTGELMALSKRFPFHPSLPMMMIVSVSRTELHHHWLETIWLWLPLSLVIGLLSGLAGRNALRARFTPEQKLRRAISNGEMKVFYQPIVDLQTGRCIGAEALVRWIRPDGSMVRPDLFIPLAEDSGLVVPLTDAVLDETLNDLGDLLAQREFYVSINLSARDVASTRFLDLLNNKLSARNIPAGRIAIEATERGFLNAGEAKASMARYRQAGHRILIDDFGTGYSSLSYLQDLDVDVLKIDKSFVDTINADAVTSGVIPHIIAMAEQLQLKIVAEGVETGGQIKYLQEHGVDCVQGWAFGKAMPAGEFMQWLSGHDKKTSPGGGSAL